MDLILWRHAEAQEPEGAMTDLDRPLTRRGEKQAARMADRVYNGETNPRHASTWATLADARFANSDMDGASIAMQRATTLLATVKEPPPSVSKYLAEVRARVCAPSVSAGCSGRGSPATSGHD